MNRTNQSKADVQFKSNQPSEYENNEQYLTIFGLLKANGSTLVGHIYIDSKQVCSNDCYLGIEPRKERSIVDIASVSVPDLNSLNTLDRSYIYDIWLKSFQLKKLTFLNDKTTFSDAFDLDKKLLKLFKKRWLDLNKQEHLFSSSIRLSINSICSENSQNQSNSTFTISYPIKFKFEWPKLIKRGKQIQFSSTQIHVGYKIKKLSLHNPSNSSVLMQIMLLDNYTSKNKFLKLLAQNTDIFNIDKTDLNLIPNTDKLNPVFSLSLSHKQPNANFQRILKTLHDLSIYSEKNSIITLLEPNESVNLQVKFSPNRVGEYENILLIRNNLTVLDSYYLRALAGTAELRLNNQAPMRTSIFFNGNQESFHKTVDHTSLLIEMNERDTICSLRNKSNKKHSSFDWKSSINGLFDYLNIIEEHDIETHDEEEIEANKFKLKSAIPTDTLEIGRNYFSSYNTKEGIKLRNLFEMKNTGTTELIVYHIMFDGEPCMSQGFEAAYCQPFKISANTNNTALLDIRYQPDFTVSFVRKRLTLVTNIGDLEYMIEVKIPHEMLSLCHDSLPRPPLETYLLYICFGLVFFFIFIILLSSLFEAKSIVKFQSNAFKHIYSVGDENDEYFKVQEFVQAETKTRTKTNTESGVISKATSITAPHPKSPKQNGHHRNLTKSSSSPKTPIESMTKKNTLASSSSKKIKEKENDSFGFPPLIFESKAPVNTNLNGSPRVSDKKEPKRASQTPPLPLPISISNSDVLSEQNLNTPKPVTVKVEKVKQQTNLKPSLKNNQISPNSVKPPKMNKLNGINMNSASSASSTSGSSTPSPPPSISPVDFTNQAKQRPKHTQFQKEQITRPKVNKNESLDLKLNLNLKSQPKIEINQINKNQLAETASSIINNVNSTIVDTNNLNIINNLSNLSTSNQCVNNNNNTEASILNNYINLSSLISPELLNLLALVNYQNQQQNQLLSQSSGGLDLSLEKIHSDYLNNQLKQLQQLNQQQLREMSYLNNVSPPPGCLQSGLVYPNTQISDMSSYLAFDQEISNIQFNANQFNQERNGQCKLSIFKEF